MRSTPWLATLLALLSLASGTGADEALYIPVGTIDTGSARIAPGLIVLHNGRIVAMGTPEAVDALPAPAGKPRDLRKMLPPPQLEALKAVSIAPLVTDANSQRGADGPMAELALCPGLAAADAVDVTDAGWAHAARAGIAYAVFAPDDTAVLGGKAVLLRPGANLLELPLRREVALFGSIAPEAYDRDRQPASRTAALEMIRAAFARAKRNEGAPDPADYRSWRPDAEALRAVLDGKLVFALRVSSPSDVDAALALFAELGLSGVLVGGNDGVAQRVDAIAKAGAAVIVDPLGSADPDRILAMPAALAKAGVPFAFASRAPRRLESGLFDQAALAVLHGLDPEAAWQALVAGPTAIYRLPASPALVVGGPADFAIYRGDPRSFSAPLIQVVRDGAIDPRALFGN